MNNKFTLELSVIYIIIQLSKSLTPIWNFNKSVENLFLNKSNYSYIICTKIWDSNNITLKKTITKGTPIIEHNFVTINNEEEIEVNWEYIESFYYFDGIGYICPSGKNNLTIYKNKRFEHLKNINLDNINDWDLKCYYQSKGHFLFLMYLNTYNKGYIFSYKIEKKKIKFIEGGFDKGLFDFIWTTGFVGNCNHMVLVLLEGKEIKLKKIKFTIDSEVSVNTVDSIKLNEQFNYIKANFTNDNYLYYISYDDSNYYSSYSNEKIYVDSNLNHISFKKNNIPLEFVNNIIIKSIDFIRYTKYIYYSIELNHTFNQQSMTYNGIIDIKNNRVLFNTNEEIKQIKPFSSNSLLIITESSAYKLCVFTKDNDNNCINECPNGQELILDTEKSNYCGNKKGNYCENYILKHNDICVPYCNNSIYIIENKSCYLCKDINENKKPYKIYNESNCIEIKPENTYFLYEKLKILKYCDKSCKTCSGDKENECLSCDNGYKLENGKCIQNITFYETCYDGEEESSDKEAQKCITCKGNKLLQEDKGNCIDDCLDGYYKESNYCKKCNSNCKTCENSNNCTSCNDHKFLINDTQECLNECNISYYKNDSEKKCYRCNSNCKTCENSNKCTSCNENMFLINDTQKCLNECNISYFKNDSEKKCYRCNSNCKSCSRGSENDNNYCLSCNENSSFKYLVKSKKYGLNCVNKCPIFTKLNESSNICIDDNNDTKEQVNVTFWKFVFVFLILFSIFVVFYVIYMCKPKDFYNINTFIDFINRENDELFGIQNDNEDKTN